MLKICKSLMCRELVFFFGRVVSLSTCTNVGAVSFVFGVVVGFALNRRLRRWAEKLLKRIKDDN